ncbi:unnamed protein product [Ambrosiozyma monospora]|uniref:Unnamed protein product n=1 Tax=Ambrosiozyma monospora TaxID=43982 RepID=A0A9W6YXS9_AMBMO|nr:unnamed protein product [Ambrosiozyma monospora]
MKENQKHGSIDKAMDKLNRSNPNPENLAHEIVMDNQASNYQVIDHPIGSSQPIQAHCSKDLTSACYVNVNVNVYVYVYFYQPRI